MWLMWDSEGRKQRSGAYCHLGRCSTRHEGLIQGATGGNVIGIGHWAAAAAGRDHLPLVKDDQSVALGPSKVH